MRRSLSVTGRLAGIALLALSVVLAWSLSGRLADLGGPAPTVSLPLPSLRPAPLVRPRASTILLVRWSEAAAGDRAVPAFSLLADGTFIYLSAAGGAPELLRGSFPAADTDAFIRYVAAAMTGASNPIRATHLGRLTWWDGAIRSTTVAAASSAPDWPAVDTVVTTLLDIRAYAAGHHALGPDPYNAPGWSVRLFAVDPAIRPTEPGLAWPLVGVKPADFAATTSGELRLTAEMLGGYATPGLVTIGPLLIRDPVVAGVRWLVEARALLPDQLTTP